MNLKKLNTKPKITFKTQFAFSPQGLCLETQATWDEKRSETKPVCKCFLIIIP